MMPVPSHLIDCVVPRDAVIDESPLDAFVRCPCGSSRFDLLFPGTTHEWRGETIPCTAEIGGKFFFLVTARCTSCNRRHLLLDADFHGWNGFVCHDPKQASIERPPLRLWHAFLVGSPSMKRRSGFKRRGRNTSSPKLTVRLTAIDGRTDLVGLAWRSNVVAAVNRHPNGSRTKRCERLKWLCLEEPFFG